MQFFVCDACFDSVFQILKMTYEYVRSGYAYTHLPSVSAFMPVYAAVSAAVVLASANVVGIFAGRSYAKIGYAIVRFIAVYMIQNTIGPFTII